MREREFLHSVNNLDSSQGILIVFLSLYLEGKIPPPSTLSGWDNNFFIVKSSMEYQKGNSIPFLTESIYAQNPPP